MDRASSRAVYFAMKFMTLPLAGTFLIDLEKQEDERGFFARSFCEIELEKMGLVSRYPQCNLSFNLKRGTLRGMHFSVQPCAETKLVRCVRGLAYDVLVDFRKESPTYLKWISTLLSPETRQMVYIPAGVAHGFQTLEDETELFYHMSAIYNPECARGILWNDSLIGIDWPILNPILSPKDQEFERISR